MKVAVVVGEFPTLSETFILDQITHLIDHGHEVDIIVPASQKALPPKIHSKVLRYRLLERTHYCLPIPKNYFLRVWEALCLLYKEIARNPLIFLRLLNVARYGRESISLTLFYQVCSLLKQKSYDIVHAHFGPVAQKVCTLRSLGILRGKFIVTFHGYDLSSFIQRKGPGVYKELFAKVDVVLPVCDFFKDRLIKLGCDQKNIIVHRNGINTDVFSHQYKYKTDNHQDVIRFITIARLVLKKGVEYGIRAVAHVSKHYPNLEYHIIGEGPLERELQELIRELDVGSRVTLHGGKTQDEIIQMLEMSDIFILPSVTSEDGDQEGIPISIAEAMSMGLPVISTYHSGISEIVRHGDSGFLVPERDENALTKSVVYLIEHPEIRRTMGKAGQEIVKQECNQNVLNTRLLEIYEQVLDGRAIQEQEQETNVSAPVPISLL